MSGKTLVVHCITPAGIPQEDELKKFGMSGEMPVYGAEQSQTMVQLRDGAPEHFHDACKRLLQTFSGKAHAVLVGSPIGEGVGLGPLQSRALLTAMKYACPSDILIVAGLFGRDDMIVDQVNHARDLDIHNFSLGLNQTGNNQQRFDIAQSTLTESDGLWLHNTSTYEPASLEFLQKCLQDVRVLGIQDASRGSDALRLCSLLQLKDSRRDFQVLAGHEAPYGDLNTDAFAQINGLVSSNANVNPSLLSQYTIDSKSDGVALKRLGLREEMLNLSGRRRDTKVEEAEAHIHGMKLKLNQIGVLETRHTGLYSYAPGSLFRTYKEA